MRVSVNMKTARLKFSRDQATFDFTFCSFLAAISIFLKTNNKEVLILILRRRTQKSTGDKSLTTARYYYKIAAIAAQSEVIHKIIAQTFKSKLDMKSI